MAYRPRRQSRYVKLRNSGFLPAEAKVLSRVPFSVPYMKKMIRDRVRHVDLMFRKGHTEKDIEAGIRLSYEAQGYIKRDRRDHKLLNVWQWIREVEDKYKKDEPEYRSPSQKRRKRFTGFVDKYERTAKRIQLK